MSCVTVQILLGPKWILRDSERNLIEVSSLGKMVTGIFVRVLKLVRIIGLICVLGRSDSASSTKINTTFEI